MSKHVPAGWQDVIIDDCCKIIRGASPRPIGDPSYFGGNVGWVRISDVTASSKYLRKTQDYLSPLGVSKSIKVTKGDLIMSICGTVGRPIIVDMEACIHDGFVQFTKINNFDVEYCYYLLQTLINEFISKAQPGTQINLNTTIVGNTSISLPPLPEQRKIAAVLSSADRSIAATEKLIAKLADLKKALMQQLLTKGISHTEFKPSTLGPIPKSWEVKLLSDAISKIIDCEHKTAPFIDNGKYFVVRTNSIKDGQIIFEDAKYTHEEAFREWTQREIPQPGDVLFTREAPAGEAALVPVNLPLCLGQRMVLLKFNNQDVNSAFFVYSLYGSEMRKCLNDMLIGTTVSRINMADIKLINCLIPPIDEQLKIADILNGVDRKLSAAKVKLAKAKDLKQGLMNDLLTGKVRVSA